MFGLDFASFSIWINFALFAAAAVVVWFADIAYRDGDIMTAIDRSTMFAAAVGVLVTAVYLAGLIERRDRTILRMGLDSAAVITIYLGSLVVLYFIR